MPKYWTKTLTLCGILSAAQSPPGFLQRPHEQNRLHSWPKNTAWLCRNRCRWKKSTGQSRNGHPRLLKPTLVAGLVRIFRAGLCGQNRAELNRQLPRPGNGLDTIIQRIIPGFDDHMHFTTPTSTRRAILPTRRKAPALHQFRRLGLYRTKACPNLQLGSEFFRRIVTAALAKLSLNTMPSASNFT